MGNEILIIEISLTSLSALRLERPTICLLLRSCYLEMFRSRIESGNIGDTHSRKLNYMKKPTLWITGIHWFSWKYYGYVSL